MKKKFVVIAALMLSMFFAVSAAQAAVYCTWANGTNANHTAISGEEIGLRAVVTNNIANMTYSWSFGDTTSSAVAAVTDRYAIETKHVYTGTVGNVFTATLTVKNADTGATVGTDTVKTTIAAATLDSRKLIAIENGLWYLHKEIFRDITGDPVNITDTHGSQIRGTVGDGWDEALNTLITGVAFEDNGFKATGDATNPYTEDVQRLVNYTTEQLAIINIARKGNGGSYTYLDPENRSSGQGMKDKYAVYFNYDHGEREYQYGLALRFLARSGYTSTKPKAFDSHMNFTGKSVSIGSWTYAQIVQQMVDFASWSQLYDQGMDLGAAPVARNAGLAVPTNKRGSWAYWGDGWSFDNATQTDIRGAYGDTAMAYWMVSGLKAATAIGATVPDFVKTELNTFLTNNQDRVATSPYYGEFRFGEALGHHMVERAGMGLNLLNWAGVATTNSRVTSAKNYISTFWNKNNYEHDQGWATSASGDNQCWVDHIPDGTAEDCFSHFQYGNMEVGHNEPVLSDACCDEYLCTQTACGYGYDPDPATCTAYDENGTCIAGQCLYNYSYCVAYDYATCVSGLYTCQIGSEWVVDAYYDTTNLFAFLNITEGLQAIGVTKTTAFPAADPYGTKYKTLLVNNQFSSGSWNDNGWVCESPYGTAWALQILSRL